MEEVCWNNGLKTRYVYSVVSPHRQRYRAAYFPTPVYVGSRYPRNDSSFLTLDDFAYCYCTLPTENRLYLLLHSHVNLCSLKKKKKKKKKKKP